MAGSDDSRHGLIYLDEWADILVLNRSLATHLVETSSICAITHRLVLQITLSALIADRTVQWVVCQKELHDSFPRLVRQR